MMFIIFIKYDLILIMIMIMIIYKNFYNQKDNTLQYKQLDNHTRQILGCGDFLIFGR